MKILVASILAALAACSASPVSALASAARVGDTNRIASLIRGGSGPNAPSGVNSWSPLMHAIHKNQKASVEALLADGAAADLASPGGETPLTMAAAYGYANIVEALLQGGASPSSQALDAALTGANDIDRFTLGQCQTSTVRVLLKNNPGLRPGISNGERLARLLKACPEIDEMLRASAVSKTRPH